MKYVREGATKRSPGAQVPDSWRSLYDGRMIEVLHRNNEWYSNGYRQATERELHYLPKKVRKKPDTIVEQSSSI